MNDKKEVGNRGEELACQHLQKRGYKIIEKNFWKPWGELDIVALAPDKTLIFFEVKTLQRKHHDLTKVSSLCPEENLTSAKLKKLQRTASLYANASSHLNDERGWQIDLLAIDIFSDAPPDIRHYPNL